MEPIATTLNGEPATMSWLPLTKSGARDCVVDHEGRRHRLHACDLVVAKWKSEADRDAWAQAAAERVVALVEYEESAAGQIAQLRSQLASMDEMRQAVLDRIAELEKK